MPAATSAKGAKKPAARKKTTAKSASKPTAKSGTPAAAVDELRDKRAEFDQPIVDTPVQVLEGGETVAIDSDDRIEIVPEGSSAKVSLGGKSVTLDGEGVKSLQRHLDRVAAGF